MNRIPARRMLVPRASDKSAWEIPLQLAGDRAILVQNCGNPQPSSSLPSLPNYPVTQLPLPLVG